VVSERRLDLKVIPERGRRAWRAPDRSREFRAVSLRSPPAAVAGPFEAGRRPVDL
jgi:hypothetical protein